MGTIQILTSVFQKVFENDSIVLSPIMTADDIEGWDSLSHVNLILAIETEFNIEFSQKEVRRFKNVGDLIVAIETKKGSN
jgi:acyl carrier protein